jgi:hypothetical protein
MVIALMATALGSLKRKAGTQARLPTGVPAFIVNIGRWSDVQKWDVIPSI